LALALAVSFGQAADHAPAPTPVGPADVYIPGPTPVIPAPSTATYTVPVGTFLPILNIPDKSRVRLSDKTLFASKWLKLEKGATHSGVVFTAAEPDVYTMPATGLILTAVKPGTTTLVLDVNSDDGPVDRYSTTITVTGGGESPPGPKPDPVSPLAANLSAAFKLESADEQALVSGLAGVYRKAITTVDTAATWGDLFTAMAADAAEAKVAGHLGAIQAVISKELKGSLPSKGAGEQSIDPSGRKKARDAFRSIADALSQLK